MEEKILLRISLFSSLSGLFVLFIILNFFTIGEKEISEISAEKEGNSVKIRGFVESVKNENGFAIIKVAEIKSVSALIFTSENISLEKNEEVEIIGKIREYKGKNEVVVERIRRT